MDTLASCPSVWSLRTLHFINYLHSFLKGGYALSLLSMRIVLAWLLISKYCHVSIVFLPHHTHCYLCLVTTSPAVRVVWGQLPPCFPKCPAPPTTTFCDLLGVDSYRLSRGSSQLELVCFMQMNDPCWHATSLSPGISSSMAALLFHFMETISF